MKTYFSIFTVIIIFTATPQFSNSQTDSQFKSERTSTSETNHVSEYTYERVFKDGIWWIYVYDGLILVDVYEE